ncbi:hypothetical protein OUZ56_005664 [Daphnia magna]|uniref:Uncharacterized protein n=1 Tax=Daphnia magna TaxID=35525 RepID=A0ABQ9YTF4_9CRUS|nr:hypothetical protein OUZ56_005664 [Daphnia magna]
MDRDLAQAFVNFTNGAAQIRAQYQGLHDALMNVLAAQQQESAALREWELLSSNKQVRRLHIHWVRILNQAGDVEGWTNAQKRQVAVRRLGGIALQWHLQSGANNPN